jgi:DNA-binding LacI/PurR family transcriptional regulator
MATTVEDIARLAGCSAGTVSRALNGSGYVSDETRQAVLREVRKTGYVPSRAGRKPKARSGALSETARGVIEVVFYRPSPYEPLAVRQGELQVGQLVDPSKDALMSQPGLSFYREQVEGAVTELRRWGYKTLFQLCTDLLQPKFLNELNAKDKAGVVLVGEYSRDLPKFIDACRHPLVLGDLILDSWPDVVSVDNTKGITLAFRHIHELGHRRIGYVGGTSISVGLTERWNAFKLNLAEHDLPLRNDWVYSGPNQIGRTTKWVKEILARPERPTAFLCCNDIAALSVLRAANDLGLSVPKDLSVIGFDDVEAAQLVTPPLTTIRVHAEEYGRRAARDLVSQLPHWDEASARREKGCRINVAPTLIQRASTGPCTESERAA